MLFALLAAALVLFGARPVASSPPSARRVATEQKGVASWYGGWHQGRRTASGDRFDARAMTAAHRTLPLGTRVRVTNLRNGRSIDVRVNDRGPMVPGRILDLSRAAAVRLDALGRGLIPVRVTVLSPRPRGDGTNG